MIVKDLDYIVNNLSQLFRLAPDLVKFVVQAARKDVSALQWFKNEFQFKNLKDVIQQIQDIVMGKRSEQIGSDEEGLEPIKELQENPNEPLSAKSIGKQLDLSEEWEMEQQEESELSEESLIT